MGRERTAVDTTRFEPVGYQDGRGKDDGNVGDESARIPRAGHGHLSHEKGDLLSVFRRDTPTGQRVFVTLA